MAFRHAVRMFVRRRAIVGLLLALAVLAVVPMAAVPHQIGDSDHEPDCPYDYCHSPEFSVPAPTFRISDNIGQSQEVGALPVATDADHSDPNQDYTMVYTLCDGDAPVVDDDEDKPEYADGDAADFTIYNDGSGQRKLRTAIDHYEMRVYRLKLVACDGNFKRGYIYVTITVNEAAGEPPRAPDRPEVEGASTSSLVVRWEAPDNAGRPDITDYDLQYRKDGTNDNWRSWLHSGTGTTAIISGLDPATAYEVQVLARNSEGSSGWSPSGIGSTHASGENRPPVFLESSPTRSFLENIGRNTAPVRNAGGPVRATDNDALAYSLEGADAASFDIVATSGQIRTRAGEIYDHEAKSSYDVRVTAEDRNGNSTSIAVTINITDVDEPPLAPAAPAVSTASDMSLSVNWDPPADNTGRPPIDTYDLQYRRGTSGSWTDGPQDLRVRTDTIAGLDGGTQYQVQVRATNHEGDSPWSRPGSGRTNVTGNDPPVFPSDPPSFRFDESMGNVPKPVTDVGQVMATDDDGDELTYTLAGADAGSFVIESGTGQIKTRSGMVYDFEVFEAIEDKDFYTVTVKATDMHQISATIAVTIHLDDVDEPPNAPSRPTVSGHSTKSLSVSWRPPANNRGRPGIESYDVQYRQDTSDSWRNGPQDVPNEPDAMGRISETIDDLDPNTRYQVQVRAENHEDSGDWSQPGSGRTLSPPTFPAGMATRSFPENTPAGRNIGARVRATYAGNTLTYSLEGTDAASFDIDDETGQLKTKDMAYDYEAREPYSYTYSVTVKASDPSDASATIDVTINITDVNEPPLPPDTPVVSANSTTSLSVMWKAPDNSDRPSI